MARSFLPGSMLEALQLEGCMSELEHDRFVDKFPCGLALDHEFSDEPAGDWRDLLYEAHRAHHYEGHERHSPYSDGDWPLIAHVDENREPEWVRCDDYRKHPRLPSLREHHASSA